MALKLFHILSFIILLLSCISHGKRDIPSDQKSSPFDFIKQLKGCHKGEDIEGIHKLKSYLKEFGYLTYVDPIHANKFDGDLERAIKTYQENYQIKPTGILDDSTVSKMIAPRCGVPDIVNGTNTMGANRKRPSSSPIHIVAHYSFFPGNPRWPPSKTRLTYGFLPGFPPNFVAPVTRAFQKWDSATHFTFSRAPDYRNADLTIAFFRRDHGDGAPFDGPGGTLAHAFAPTNGRFHYDADERWSIGPSPNAFDLETVAIHEIGHLLGLGHSSVPQAIMFPSIGPGQTKNLHPDDIQGIRVLYNV